MLIGIDRDGQMNFNEVAKRIMEVRTPQGRAASCNAQCETPLDAEVVVAVAPVEWTDSHCSRFAWACPVGECPTGRRLRYNYI